MFGCTSLICNDPPSWSEGFKSLNLFLLPPTTNFDPVAFTSASRCPQCSPSNPWNLTTDLFPLPWWFTLNPGFPGPWNPNCLPWPPSTHTDLHTHTHKLNNFNLILRLCEIQPTNPKPWQMQRSLWSVCGASARSRCHDHHLKLESESAELI